jgi:6-phosphofructokinase
VLQKVIKGVKSHENSTSEHVMAVQNGSSGLRSNEQTPLLIDESRSIERDDGSSATLTDSRRRDEEDGEDEDKANQHVGRARGSLIMLSLCGLMFLQGVSLLHGIVREALC